MNSRYMAASAMLLVGGLCPGDEKKGDGDKLQGVWEVVSLEMDGERLPGVKGIEFKLAVKGETLDAPGLAGALDKVKFTFVIDATKSREAARHHDRGGRGGLGLAGDLQARGGHPHALPGVRPAGRGRRTSRAAGAFSSWSASGRGSDARRPSRPYTKRSQHRRRLMAGEKRAAGGSADRSKNARRPNRTSARCLTSARVRPAGRPPGVGGWQSCFSHSACTAWRRTRSTTTACPPRAWGP